MGVGQHVQPQAVPLRGTGRFSFAGADPYLILRTRGRALEIECRREVYEGLTIGVARERGPTLAALRDRLPAAPPDGEYRTAKHESGQLRPVAP